MAAAPRRMRPGRAKRPVGRGASRAPESAKTRPVMRMYGVMACAGRNSPSTPLSPAAIPSQSAAANAPSHAAGSPSTNRNGRATSLRIRSGAPPEQRQPREEPRGRAPKEIGRSGRSARPARAPASSHDGRPRHPTTSISSGHPKPRNIAGPLAAAAITNPSTSPTSSASSPASAVPTSSPVTAPPPDGASYGRRRRPRFPAIAARAAPSRVVRRSARLASQQPWLETLRRSRSWLGTRRSSGSTIDPGGAWLGARAVGGIWRGIRPDLRGVGLALDSQPRGEVA